MFIARWQIDARFGHKPMAIEMMKQWERDIGAKLGMPKSQYLSGSIGVKEATIENNVSVASLAELEQFFAKLGTMDAHKKWGADLEQHVVSGTSRWEIFRVIEGVGG